MICVEFRLLMSRERRNAAVDSAELRHLSPNNLRMDRVSVNWWQKNEHEGRRERERRLFLGIMNHTSERAALKFMAQLCLCVWIYFFAKCEATQGSTTFAKLNFLSHPELLSIWNFPLSLPCPRGRERFPIDNRVCDVVSFVGSWVRNCASIAVDEPPASFSRSNVMIFNRIPPVLFIYAWNLAASAAECAFQ